VRGIFGAQLAVVPEWSPNESPARRHMVLAYPFLNARWQAITAWSAAILLSHVTASCIMLPSISLSIHRLDGYWSSTVHLLTFVRMHEPLSSFSLSVLRGRQADAGGSVVMCWCLTKEGPVTDGIPAPCFSLLVSSLRRSANGLNARFCPGTEYQPKSRDSSVPRRVRAFGCYPSVGYRAAILGHA